MTLVWGSILLALSAVFEILAGSRGVSLPLTGLTAFYLLVCQKQLTIFPLACAAGIMVDIHFARAGLPTLLLQPLIAGLAIYWRENGNSAAIIFLLAPGFMIGSMHLALVWLLMILGGGFFSAANTLAPFGGIVLSALFLPCLALLYDWVGGKAGLARIRDVRPEKKTLYSVHF